MGGNETSSDEKVEPLTGVPVLYQGVVLIIAGKEERCMGGYMLEVVATHALKQRQGGQTLGEMVGKHGIEKRVLLPNFIA